MWYDEEEKEGGDNVKMVKKYDEACDYYLFDKGGQQETLGGTGQQFDWEVLRNSRIEKPFFHHEILSFVFTGWSA